MRLRLVVRRNGLPETNVIWPVPLENKPTISILLEHVNEILPLESTDWGLDDYTVELKGSDGSSFECLHFQLVETVLKEDDQVFIRPLLTDDLRRRRVSGRLQISNDGKHLIDGIAFGRPLIRAPRGRPALDIPPRKRRRIGFQDEVEDVNEDEHDDPDYQDPQELQEPMLLLTNGEEQQGDRRRSIRIAADFDDLDANPQDENEGDHVPLEMEGQDLDQESSGSDEDEDDDMEHELSEDDEDDLAKELEDLQKDGEDEDTDAQSTPGLLPGIPQDPWKGQPRQQARPMSANANTSANGGLLEEQLLATLSKDLLNQNLHDLHKMAALHTAFPMAPVQVCHEVLTAEEGDVKKSYLTLLQAFQPKLPESEALKRSDFLKGSELLKRWHENQGQLSPPEVNDNVNMDVPDVADQPDDDDDDEESEDEEDEGHMNFIRRFDRQGLPPGSISSGNALKAMADIANGLKGTNGVHTSFEDNKSSGDSKAISQIPTGSKRRFDESQAVDDDDTSSSGSSSSSDNEEEANDDGASDSSSSDSEDEYGGVNGNLNGDADGSDTSSSAASSDSDSDSDSDSAPEEQSVRKAAIAKPKATSHIHVGVNHSDTTSSSSEDSDADDETSSSGESSDDDSSDSESSSGSDSGERDARTKRHVPNATATQNLHNAAVSKAHSPPVSLKSTGIPGTGSVQTKKRNERRRLAQKTKQDIARAAALGTLPSVDQDASPADESTHETMKKSKADMDKELFEAKRQALLDAISNGGVEVGPGGELDLGESQVGNKRKRDKPDTPKNVKNTKMSDQDIPDKTPKDITAVTAVAEETDSPSSTQKRRKLDLGANRRLIFGALGLRNPKSKDDEDKLRNKLMKDVRPLQNARISEEEATTKSADVSEQQKERAPVLPDEDPDAWRQKITYRAVECCQEGVELSEPPFPFVQRWDPQQQNGWFHKNNKRGGRGKKVERNQPHFYQDDQSQGKKRVHESQGWDESYYDDSMQAAQTDDTPDIVLNYDDVQDHTVNGANDTIHMTDIDDLPSLPDNLNDLKPLHPGEAQNGMVITWKQFIMSKATKWQPQVLSLSGVICRIDDGATGLEVLLAKRDRDLEMPEKEYDNNTGRRVYDKFEAPEVDDDEEEEDEETKRMREGYRTLSFATIQDPRILQPAIPLGEPAGETTIPSIEQEPEERTELQQTKISEDLRECVVNADVTMEPKDTTFEGFDDSILPHHDSEVMDTTTDEAHPAQEVRRTTKSSEPSETPNSFLEGIAQHSISTVGHLGKVRSPAENSVSDLSQVSSPSRQLHDGTTSIIDVSAGDVLPLGLSDGISALIEQTTFDPTFSDSAPEYEESSMQIHEADVITGTPRISHHKRKVPSSSASSVRSGRQPDMSMNMDMDQPFTFRATTEDSTGHDDQQNHGVSLVLGKVTEIVGDSEDQDETPVPSSAQKNGNLETPKKHSAYVKDSPSKRDLTESVSSTPCSLASLGTVWCTAATSQRNTQSPSKVQLLSSMKSEKSQTSNEHDAEYEEAMRKLDDFSEDEEVSQNVSKISDSFKKKSQSSKPQTQSSSFGGAANNDRYMGCGSDFDRLSSLPPRARTDMKISPPPILRREGTKKSQVPALPPIKTRDSPPASKTRRSNRTSSQNNFSIPSGTQVLEISSDSDEPKFVEHYPDDDKDESYSPARDDDEENISRARSPKAPGRVKKSRPAGGSTAPLASQKKAPKTRRDVGTSQNSYNSQLRGMESAAAAMKRLKKGTKVKSLF
ncbi:hypothetical protein TruAng_004827 [Truncatella angustata]|nr:hypothetical protein TruAng_004827 [Truncatella angustata]